MRILLVAMALSWAACPQEVRATTYGTEYPRAEQRGTDTAATRSQLSGSGASPESAQQQAERVREEREKAKFRLDLALVVATVLTFIVLCVQSVYLRRTVHHAEKHSRIELRAYLRLGEITVTQAGVEITITNAGKTPAQEIRAGLEVYRGPKSQFQLPIWDLHEATEATLAQGDKFGQSETMPALAEIVPDAAARIAKGDPDWVFVSGRAEYVDVFGRHCHTDYAFDIEFSKLMPPGVTGPKLNVTSGRNVYT